MKDDYAEQLEALIDRKIAGNIDEEELERLSGELLHEHTRHLILEALLKEPEAQKQDTLSDWLHSPDTLALRILCAIGFPIMLVIVLMFWCLP